MLNASPQALTEVSSTQKLPLGTRYSPDGGKTEFIYLKGVASTAIGSWVTFDEAGITALLAANAKGQVGVAQAALVANTYGWYQIFGTGDALMINVADNGDLYHVSAGVVDDAVVAGDRIKGAWARETVGGTAALGAVQLAYPFVDDIAD